MAYHQAKATPQMQWPTDVNASLLAGSCHLLRFLHVFSVTSPMFVRIYGVNSVHLSVDCFQHADGAAKG